MEKTVTGILTAFFNVGEGKRSSIEWLKELKEMTTEAKRELADAICAFTGDTIKV